MSKTYYCEDIYEIWPDKNDNRRCYNLFKITEDGDYQASFINQENILKRLVATEKTFFNVNVQTKTITISTKKSDEYKLEFKEADEDFIKHQKTLSEDLRWPRHDSSKYKKRVRWEGNAWDEVDDPSDPGFWSVPKKQRTCDTATGEKANLLSLEDFSKLNLELKETSKAPLEEASKMKELDTSGPSFWQPPGSPIDSDIDSDTDDESLQSQCN